MKGKVLKVKDLYDLVLHIPLGFEGKMKVAFKVGKRKKLKNLSISYRQSCDCCGPILRVDSGDRRLIG